MNYRHVKKFALLAAIILSAVVSHFSGGWNQYHLLIIITIGINIVLAVSLNLINGYTGQFSLGHAGFMAIGAYVSAYLSTEYGANFLRLFGGHAGALAIALLFLGVLILGGIAAAVAGLIVGVPSLRLKGDYLAIVTLGFGEIIRVIIQNTDAVGGARGYSGIANYTTLFWTFALAAVTIYVVVSLIDSTYGRGFLTVRDDEIAAEAVGINTTRYKVVAFVLGAFFAGIAGGLYAHINNSINPQGFDFQVSILIVTMVILGGMGSTPGVVLAAVVLTLLPEFLRWFAKSDLLDWLVRHAYQFLSPEHFAVAAAKTKELFESRMILFSILLIALMLLRPQGLFGALPRRKASR
ncbi:MAG: branched-chain amino acid ABC transporter permease [Verrucomicrobia bacterium]|nr:branched-chain amino acid ABC transporter permease [Verrucomicrobiota bacterium]